MGENKDCVAPIFDGLQMHVTSEKVMGLQILRYKVKNHGGELLEKESGSSGIVCCDRGVSKDRMKDLMELFSKSKKGLCGFVLDSKWINESVKERRRLDMEPFVLMGEIPKLSEIAGPTPVADTGEGIGSTAAAAGKRSTRDEDEGEGGEGKRPKIASIFTMGKKASKGAGDFVHHAERGVVTWVSPDFMPTGKVAAFDMDGTIITTKSGNVFSKNADDWQLLQPALLTRKLRQLVADGYCLALISNQRGIAKDPPTQVEQFRRKIRAVQAALDIPLVFFAAYKANEFRKPCPGMWSELLQMWAAKGARAERSQSFYVGDAAGRPEGEKKFSGSNKKDFADSDRKFALNVGLNFQTPEEFFLGKPKEPFAFSGFDPASVLSPSRAAAHPDYAVKHQELAILVGYPGSGKSFFAHQHLVAKGYKWVNRDTLKDMGKCKKVCAEALAEGKSAVVDNTNPTAKARAEFIKIAKEHSVKVRCFRMEANKEMAQHLNRVREMAGSDHAPVPAQIYGFYDRDFQEPALREGLEAIVRVPFVPKFEDEDEERIFKWRL